MTLARSLSRGALLAAIGPLALAAGNLGEFWIGDVAILVLATSAMAMAVTFVRRATLSGLGEDRGASLDVVVIGALTLPFLLVHELLSVMPTATIPRIRETLVGTLVLSGVLVAWILRSARPPRRALAALTITVAVVAASSLGRLVLGQIRLARDLASSATARELRSWNADSAVRTVSISSRPDVFLLVLDGYAGDSLLLADYGVDHGPLRDTLATLGFEPRGPHTSNYSRTLPSISSLLNFSQVAQVQYEDIGERQHAGFLSSLITDNRTIRFFQAAGYEIHWAPAPYFGGRMLPPAGVHVHRAWRSVLAQLWTDSDLITTWLRLWTPGVVLRVLGRRTDVSAARDSGLALLPRLASDGRPTFAFVHLFATHEPLSYDDRCHVDTRAVARYGQRQAYAASVRCLDAELIRVFQDIIARASDSVIIVALGDHAPSSIRFDENRSPAESIPPTIMAARFDAGAFFYIPPRLRTGFSAPHSAVNVVPAVLNSAFGARIPFQPDSLFYSKARPSLIHHFVPVTRERAH